MVTAAASRLNDSGRLAVFQMGGGGTERGDRFPSKSERAAALRDVTLHLLLIQ